MMYWGPAPGKSAIGRCQNPGWHHTKWLEGKLGLTRIVGQQDPGEIDPGNTAKQSSSETITGDLLYLRVMTPGRFLRGATYPKDDDLPLAIHLVLEAYVDRKPSSVSDGQRFHLKGLAPCYSQGLGWPYSVKQEP